MLTLSVQCRRSEYFKKLYELYESSVRVPPCRHHGERLNKLKTLAIQKTLAASTAQPQRIH
jgi:hypothetical protein